MEREIPTCDGCGEKGYYLCPDCQTPDHEAEERNHNVQQPDNHNRYNYEWGN
jgi:hypothetical protein